LLSLVVVVALEMQLVEVVLVGIELAQGLALLLVLLIQ
jgi:hypothetical protein